VRLRPLTEAECYARCYGGQRDDSVVVVRSGAEQDADGTPDSYEAPENAGHEGREAA
jgi:hypothetical protein